MSINKFIKINLAFVGGGIIGWNGNFMSVVGLLIVVLAYQIIEHDEPSNY